MTYFDLHSVFGTTGLCQALSCNVTRSSVNKSTYYFVNNAVSNSDNASSSNLICG
jgi:hypothetical protein